MGLKLSYEIWGDGAVEVILLHGFTGDHSAWDHLRPKLGPRVRALAVDLPGHGQSDLPDGTGESGFEETVDAISELVGKTTQSSVDVIGYSQGARLGIGLAVRRPQRVRRLVLESSAPGLSARKQRSARQREDALLALRIRERGIEAFVDEWEQRRRSRREASARRSEFDEFLAQFGASSFEDLSMVQDSSPVS